HKDPWVRGCAPMLLADVGGKDTKVITWLRDALGDKDWGVKGNANAALWKLTEDLALTVPLWLEALSHLDPSLPEREKPDLESARRNLIGLVSALKLKELSEKQPEKLVPVLINHLSHKSSDIRAMAARVLGAASLNPKGKEAVISFKAETKLRPLLKD